MDQGNNFIQVNVVIGPMGAEIKGMKQNREDCDNCRLEKVTGRECYFYLVACIENRIQWINGQNLFLVVLYQNKNNIYLSFD